MRRPVTGKSAIVAKPLLSAKTLLAVAIGLMLVGLQQPWWSAAQVRADGGVTLATLLAVTGAGLGLSGVAGKLRSGIRGRLWVSQLPLFGVAFWTLIDGFIHGGEIWQSYGFGPGAGFALAGAILAAQALGSLPKLIKPVMIGLLALISIIAEATLNIWQSQAAYPYYPLWLSVTFWVSVVALGLYLTWWLLVPILQNETALGSMMFPTGRLFPRTSVEQVVARATVFSLVAIAVTVYLIAFGSVTISYPNSPTFGTLGSIVLLLPAIGAACYPIIEKNRPRCAPALLRSAVHKAALIAITAVTAYRFVQAIIFWRGGISLLNLMPGGVTLFYVLVTGLSWMQFKGFINLNKVGQVIRDKSRTWFLADIETPTWSVDDIPILVKATNENWSGAHRWVGPTLHDDSVESGPVATDKPRSQPVHASRAVSAQLPISGQLPVSAPSKRADTTTHLPLAVNNQAELSQVGETNPALTDSGRLVIPLARPKWTPQQALDPNIHPGLLARIATEAPHLRPQVARNPSASAELLNWLVSLDDPDVNVALASIRVGSGG